VSDPVRGSYHIRNVLRTLTVTVNILLKLCHLCGSFLSNHEQVRSRICVCGQVAQSNQEVMQFDISLVISCYHSAVTVALSCIIFDIRWNAGRAPCQNFWVDKICSLQPTFYKRSMACNSQYWDWGQTEILCDKCKIQ